MSSTKINESVAPEVEAQIIQSLTDMSETHLPFLTELGDSERTIMSKFSSRYSDFVDRCLEHAQTSPKFLTGYVEVDEFTKDVALRNSLRRIRGELKKLDDKLKDTCLMAGSEAYRAARLYYSSVKAAAKNGVEGASSVSKELASLYKKRAIRTDAGGPVEPVVDVTPDDVVTANDNSVI